MKIQFKFAIVAIGRAPGTASIIKQEITGENVAWRYLINDETNSFSWKRIFASSFARDVVVLIRLTRFKSSPKKAVPARANFLSLECRQRDAFPICVTLVRMCTCQEIPTEPIPARAFAKKASLLIV